MNGYDLTVWTIRHINVFNRKIYQWFQLRNLSGNLLSGVVSHFLPQYLQCGWGNTKEQPTTCGIEEGTS